MFKTSIRKSAANWIRTRLLIPVAGASLTGLVLAEIIYWGHGVIALAIAVPPVLLGLFLLWPRRLGVVLLLFFSLGFLRGLSVWHQTLPADHWLYFRPSGPHAYEGTIAGPASSGDGLVRRVVELRGVGLPEGWRALSGRVLLHLPVSANLPVAGESVRFFGRIRVPAGYRNPGSFDYAAFLKRRGIAGVVHLDDPGLVRVMAPPGRWHLQAYLDRARDRAVARLEAVMGEPHRGWVETVLVNVRADLDHATFAAFQRSGQVHLLSISGLHVMFLFLSVMVPLRWLLGRWNRLLVFGRHEILAAAVATAAAVGYALFSGGDYPALRGALFAVAGLAILWTGRLRHLVVTLTAAALIVALWMPAAPWEASFQLSFAAILGIYAVLPVMDRLGKRGGEKRRWLRPAAAAFLTTLGATLATLPIVLHHFGEFSLIAMLISPLVIPVFGLLIFPALVLLMGVSIIHLATARIVYAAIRPCLDLFVAVIAGSARGGDLVTLWWRPSVAATWMVLAGVGLILLAWRGAARRTVATGVTVLGISLGLVAYRISVRPPDGLTTTFLDVGQGDAIILEAKGGGVVLIDAGPVYGTQGDRRRRPFNVGDRVILPFLQTRGLRHIDVAILSHPHPDHYGGLAAVGERVPIREVWINADAVHHPALAPLWRILKGRGTEVREVSRGTEQALGGLSLQVVWPSGEADRLPGVNDHSIVVRAGYDQTSLLFAGDIERQAEAAMQGDRLLPSDILKAPHHGSRTSNSEPWLEAVHPSLVVISCAVANRFGFPHPEVMERYAALGMQVLRTDRDGAVVLKTAGEGWTAVTRAAPSLPSGGLSSGASSF